MNIKQVSKNILMTKDSKQQVPDAADDHAFNQKTNDSQHFSEAVGTQQNQ